MTSSIRITSIVFSFFFSSNRWHWFDEHELAQRCYFFVLSYYLLFRSKCTTVINILQFIYEMPCQCASIAVFTTTTNHTWTMATTTTTTIVLCSRTGFKCLRRNPFFFRNLATILCSSTVHSLFTFAHSLFIYAHFCFDLWLKSIHCTIKRLIIIFNTQIQRCFNQYMYMFPCKMALKI